MNARKPNVFLLVAIFLFLSSIIAYAAPAETEDTGDSGLASDIILGIAKAVFELVFSFIGTIIAAQLELLMNAYKFIILWNPNPYDVKDITGYLIGILAPIYLIALILTGVYFIFVASDPASRAKAKDNLMRLIFSMVLVTLSMEIYAAFLDVSLALSKAIVADVHFDSGNSALGFFGTVSLASANLIPIIFVLVLVVAGLSVAMRHIMVYVMAVVFPLTIFLYFFDFTREAGSKLMKHTFMSIFTQVVQAFILAVTVVAVNSAGTTGVTSGIDRAAASFLCIFVAMGGFVMLALAPLMMMGIMEWIGATLAAAGAVLAFVPGGQVYGAILSAAGSVAAGMGPGGLIAGGTAYGLGSSFNSVAGDGGGGGGHRKPITQRPKQAVLAAEKKERQTETHRRRAEFDKNASGVRPDLAAAASKPDWRSGKYGSDSAQNLGGFFGRAEHENAPAPPKPPENKPKSPIYNTLKGAGKTLAMGALSPAVAVYRGAKGIKSGAEYAAGSIKQGSFKEGGSGKGGKGGGTK